MISRRLTLAFLAAAIASPLRAMTRPTVTAHRSPTCGCCGAWANHLRRAGFPVTIVNEADLAPVKNRAGVPEALQSCHTAFVEGYVIEGHVPVEAIEKLLAERPQILGLAVPDMPVGSPGMEMPDTKPEPFSVMAFHKDGSLTVFLDYPEGYRKPA
ncbi:DUF411 domain-containing protein [Rhabdaerophilum sp. SD176]|uniref:DUF411 domain-containing protein n=1 Tax=Rhabdaerophilum sp. SD176 TaxID=2983548 RepID=UPI0024E0054D|nr:DUF411 domain-containing protein [Rhabdaerophilum sp. SD176]